MTDHRPTPASPPASLRLTYAARGVQATPDPLALYRALSANGTEAHKHLLESADSTGTIGLQSLVVVRSALYVRAADELVHVTALSENGRVALEWLDSLPFERMAASPGSVCWRIRQQPALDGDERDRYQRPSPLDLIRRLVFGVDAVDAPGDLAHVAVMALSYDLIDYFESLPRGQADPLGQPLLECWIPDQLIVLDHRAASAQVVAAVWEGPGHDDRRRDAAAAVDRLAAVVESMSAQGHVERIAAPALAVTPDAYRVDMPDAVYGDLVTTLQEHIRAGDVYQIVPSRTFSAPCARPLDAYARLRARNPSPYQFYLRSEWGVLLGTSPETCLRIDGGSRQVSIHPIAGTARRGRREDGTIDPDLDARLEAALRLDAKELAEHVMLVDLARNDVARVSMPGTRKVTRLLDVERYQHVMHLVSQVDGTLSPAFDALSAYAASMNMGTLVGAPKVRAAALLREHERSRRGFYGGAVGYLTAGGHLETAITIRSAVVKDGLAHVRSGAGVVFDSQPAAEALETARKAASVLQAVLHAGGAHV